MRDTGRSGAGLGATKGAGRNGAGRCAAVRDQERHAIDFAQISKTCFSTLCLSFLSFTRLCYSMHSLVFKSDFHTSQHCELIKIASTKSSCCSLLHQAGVHNVACGPVSMPIPSGVPTFCRHCKRRQDWDHIVAVCMICGARMCVHLTECIEAHRELCNEVSRELIAARCKLPGPPPEAMPKVTSSASTSSSTPSRSEFRPKWAKSMATCNQLPLPLQSGPNEEEQPEELGIGRAIAIAITPPNTQTLPSPPPIQPMPSPAPIRPRVKAKLRRKKLRRTLPLPASLRANAKHKQLPKPLPSPPKSAPVPSPPESEPLPSPPKVRAKTPNSCASTIWGQVLAGLNEALAEPSPSKANSPAFSCPSDLPMPPTVANVHMEFTFCNTLSPPWGAPASIPGLGPSPSESDATSSSPDTLASCFFFVSGRQSHNT